MTGVSPMMPFGIPCLSRTWREVFHILSSFCLPRVLAGIGPSQRHTMEFHQTSAGIFVPDGLGVREALARITHLGIGAHPDDLEFMAFDGIARCYANEGRWFGGVTCTDGAGSARAGEYAGYTDRQMMDVRRGEQNQAAAIGRYGMMIQLGYPSPAIRDPRDPSLAEDLAKIWKRRGPKWFIPTIWRTSTPPMSAWRLPPSGPCAGCPVTTGPQKSSAAKCGATWTGCRTERRC